MTFKQQSLSVGPHAGDAKVTHLKMHAYRHTYIDMLTCHPPADQDPQHGCLQPLLVAPLLAYINCLLIVASVVVALVEFFNHIANDAPLMQGLQQLGKEAWYVNGDSPRQLAEYLAQLTVSRALPITTVREIGSAFALTQASTAFRRYARLCSEAHLLNLRLGCETRMRHVHHAVYLTAPFSSLLLNKLSLHLLCSRCDCTTKSEM